MRVVNCRTVLAGVSAAMALGVSAGPAFAASSNPTSSAYAAEIGFPSDGVSSAGSTFVVPNAKCPTDSAANFGDQIFDTQSNQQAYAGLQVTCTGGVASYSLFAVTIDGGLQFATTGVAPGDEIIVSDYETTTNTVATATDVTSSAVATSQDGTGDASGYPSANYDIGLLAFTGVTPQFRTVEFKKVEVNGEHLGQTDPTAVNLESGSDLQVKTSPAPEPAGSHFLLTFKHVS
jgi:hypothetical protein